MGTRRESFGLYGLAALALGASGLAWASAPDTIRAARLGTFADAAPRLRLSFDQTAEAADRSEHPVASRTIEDRPRSDTAAEIVVAVPTVSAPVFDEPTRTGSVAAIMVPDLPPAPVVVRTEDAVAGAIQLRLGEYAKAIAQPRLSRKDREAIVEFYAGRKGEPLWVGREGWTARGKAVLAQLGRAEEDGLDPSHYATPILPAPGGADTPSDLAEAELKLSSALFLYARDARGGRIEPSRLSALITPKLELPAPETVLTRVGEAADPAAALAGFNPQQAGYLALRKKLAEIRANRPANQPMVRAPRSREVSTTQAIAVLDDLPVIRPEGPYANPRLEADIVANMERWRWLPAEMGDRYVAVNVPEFKLRLIENGRVAHETRVITGKPDSPTPIFSGIMEYAIVNPSWYIPPSIMKKEILPGLAADPSYAARRGYEVIHRGGQISVRQPPGERNALGFIKFMFPNNHAVYLHDTPNRTLFGSARRAFSHGCVRVEHPFQLADFVLGSQWSEERLKRLIGRGERTIWLPQKLPVHLTYFTVEVDSWGELRSYEDIYGYNRRVRAALGLGA